jgi:PAS domain S-box-containing protein
MKNKQSEMLSKSVSTKPSPGADRIKNQELVHELQIYQVELEMQNEELRNSYEQLEKERQRFQGFFNLAPVCYFVLDHISIITACNETTINFFGTSRAKLIDKRFQSLVFPEDLSIFYMFIRDLFCETKKQNCELRMLKQNGSIATMYLEGRSVYNFNSTSSFYIAAFDITEKRIIESKQKDTAERLEMALSTSAMGTIKICIPTGKVDLDEYASSIMEIGRGVVNSSYNVFVDHILPEDQEATHSLIETAIHSRTSLNVIFRRQSKTGDLKYIEMKGNVRQSGKQIFFIGVICDITSKRLLEIETEQLRENIQDDIMKAIFKAEENEKSRLSYALHDGLAQLLYAVQLNLESIENNPTKEGIANIKNLVRQTIFETRTISFQLAPSILNDHGLQQSLYEMFNRIVHVGPRINTEISGFEKRLEISSEIFIFRIIQELVNNILKHSKATIADVKVKYNAPKLSILISDNGIGINKPHGSGLCSVSNRVKLYKGTINIRVKESGGTEITITIPDIK